MRFNLRAILATALILYRRPLLQSQTPAGSTADIGTWRISRLLYYNNSKGAIGDTPLTKRQVRRLVGRTVTISRNGCQVNPFTGDHSKEDRVVSVDTRAMALHSEHVPSNITLGLPEKFIAFHEGCYLFWLRSDGNLVAAANDNLHWFEFEKVPPAAPDVSAKAKNEAPGPAAPRKLP